MNELLQIALKEIMPLLTIIVLIIIFYLLLQLFLTTNKWLDELLFYLLLVLCIPELFTIFDAAKKLIEILNNILLAFIPIITSILVLLQGPFTLLNWNPVTLLIIQIIIFICNKLLIPALFLSIMLDLWSRGMPEMPLSRAAQFIRSFLIISASITMLILTGIMTISSGVVLFVNNSITSPIKKAIEQSVPIVGSILVQAMSMIKRTQVISSSVLGAAAIISFISVLAMPLVLIILKALQFKLLSVISEPFLPSRITGLFDDLSKSLFILCAVVAIVFSSVVILLVILFSMTHFLGGKN